MKFTLFAIFCFSFLLTACSSFPHSLPPSTTPINWQTHVDAVRQLQSWSLKGAISIRNTNKTQMASLKWDQHQQHYQFALFGPLGLGHVTIEGDAHQITLLQGDKPPISAATPELLLQNQLGWHMPVSDLYYWARGLPAPHSTAKMYFNSQHNLYKLSQGGWDITYLSYQTVHQLTLPRQIELVNASLQIKLVLKEWLIHE